MSGLDTITASHASEPKPTSTQSFMSGNYGSDVTEVLHVLAGGWLLKSKKKMFPFVSCPKEIVLRCGMMMISTLVNMFWWF